MTTCSPIAPLSTGSTTVSISSGNGKGRSSSSSTTVIIPTSSNVTKEDEIEAIKAPPASLRGLKSYRYSEPLLNQLGTTSQTTTTTTTIATTPPPLPPHRGSSSSSLSSGIARSAKVHQPRRHESASVLYYDSSKSSSSTCSGGSLRSSISISNVDIHWDPNAAAVDQLPPPPPPRHSSKTPPPPLPPKPNNLTDKKHTSRSSKGILVKHGVNSNNNNMNASGLVGKNGNASGPSSSRQSTSPSSSTSPKYEKNGHTNWNSYDKYIGHDLKAIQKRAVLEFYLKHKRKKEQEQHHSHSHHHHHHHQQQQQSTSTKNVDDDDDYNSQQEIKRNGSEKRENRLTSTQDCLTSSSNKASSSKVELVLSHPSNGLPNSLEEVNFTSQSASSSRLTTGLNNCQTSPGSQLTSSNPMKHNTTFSSSSSSSSSYSPQPPAIPPLPSSRSTSQPLQSSMNLSSSPKPANIFETTDETNDETPSIPPLPSLPPPPPPPLPNSSTPSSSPSNTLDSCFTGPGSSGTLTSTSSTSSSSIGHPYQQPSTLQESCSFNDKTLLMEPLTISSSSSGSHSTALRVTESIKNDQDSFTIVTTASCFSSPSTNNTQVTSSLISYQRPVISAVNHHHQQQHSRMNNLTNSQQQLSQFDGKEAAANANSNSMVSPSDSRQYKQSVNPAISNSNNKTVDYCSTTIHNQSTTEPSSNGKNIGQSDDHDHLKETSVLEPWSHRRLWPKKCRNVVKTKTVNGNVNNNNNNNNKMIIDSKCNKSLTKGINHTVASSDGYSSGGSLSPTSSSTSSSCLSLDIIENAATTPSSNQGRVNSCGDDVVSRLTGRLNYLRSEQVNLVQEMEANEKLGCQLVSKLKMMGITCQESEKIAIHLEEIEKITRLLLSLSCRLKSVETDLSKTGKLMANGAIGGDAVTSPGNHDDEAAARVETRVDARVDSNNPEFQSLLSKRNKLLGQLDEAIQLKESIERRSQTISDKIIVKYFNQSSEDVDQFVRFIKLKSKLIVDQRQLNEKIDYGERQLINLASSTPSTTA